TTTRAEPTPERVRALLTCALIDAWLGEQPQTAIAGECRSPARCLLACYLRAKTGRQAFVTQRELCLRDAADERTLFCLRLPEEIGALIDGFDALGEPGDPVTVNQARALLAALSGREAVA